MYLDVCQPRESGTKVLCRLPLYLSVCVCIYILGFFSQRMDISLKLGSGIHILCSYTLTEQQNRIVTE